MSTPQSPRSKNKSFGLQPVKIQLLFSPPNSLSLGIVVCQFTDFNSRVPLSNDIFQGQEYVQTAMVGSGKPT